MKKIFLTFSLSILILFTGITLIDAVPSSAGVFGEGGSILGEGLDIGDYTIGGENCEGKALRCVAENIIEYLKKLVIPIAIVSLSYAGLYLLIVRNEEEVFQKRKNEVFGIFTGFMIILLSATLIDKMFFGMEGEVLNGGDNDIIAKNVLTEINGLISLLEMLVIPIALLVIIFSAFKLIFRSDEDEELSKMKSRIIYVLVGIAVVLTTGEIVQHFTGGGGPVGVVPDAEPIIRIAVNWINYLLSFLGVVGVLVIVWAGAQMVIHFGDEERIENSKSIIKFTVVGLIIGFSAWTIVRFFLMAGN